MRNSVLASICACLTLAMAPVVAKSPNVNSSLDQQGRLREFYGIPLTLTIDQLEKSDLKFVPGWEMNEGDYYPTAKIMAKNGVEFSATFSQGGDLYMLETSSARVVGPHGIAIGSTLSELEKAIPKGNFFWHATHGRRAVTFNGGDGIYYEFSPVDIPAKLWVYNPNSDLADRSIKIRAIRIAPRRYQASE